MNGFVSSRALHRFFVITCAIIFIYNTSEAQYKIIRQNKEIHTNDTNYVNSMITNPPVRIQSNCPLPKDDSAFYAPFGRILWDGNNARQLNDSIMYQTIGVFCFENGFIRKDQLINSITNAEENCNIAQCLEPECNGFWQDETVVKYENNQIVIHTPNNRFFELYKGLNLLDPYIQRVFVNGSNNDYVINYSIVDNSIYIAVIRDLENDIVNVIKLRR